MRSRTTKDKNTNITLDPKRDIMMAYPTPIFNTDVSDSGTLNAGLKKIILEKKEKKAGTLKSNTGGWHSTDNIFMWDEPEIQKLTTIIDSLVQQAVNIMSRNKPWSGKISYEGWANVNENGHYNKMHNHPNSHWSGIYYVDAASEGEDKSDENSGILEFQDPRGFVNMLSMPGNPFAQTLQVKPVSGKILIFPSFLYHTVNPYNGNGTRISIAFNSRIRMTENAKQ